ncbi:uncharacterized protein ACWYII_020552 [Salvelinus alpinus]
MSLLCCQWRRAPALHLTVPRVVSADWQLYRPLAEVYSPMPIKLRTRHLAAKRSGHKCATKEHVQTGAKHQEEQSTVNQQGDLSLSDKHPSRDDELESRVIDFYFQLKSIDLQVEGDVFIVDHFVAGIILHGDKVAMRKNTLSKTRLEQHSCWIGVCNVGNYHWILLYVNCRTHSAIVLDPTGSPNAESHMSENLVKHIRYWFEERTQETGTESVFSNVPWQATIPHTKQSDGYNCGVCAAD